MILHKPYKDIIPAAQDYVLNWNNYNISVIKTPGGCDHSISYKIILDNTICCITGELILKDGQIKDLFSLQKDIPQWIIMVIWGI